MWEPDPLVEDWKSRRRIRRVVVLAGLAVWTLCLGFARWQSAPTACDRAQTELCSLTWRCDLSSELVSQWPEPVCEEVLHSMHQVEASGSWADTLCAALDHVQLDALRAQAEPQHIAQVHTWQRDRCWWR